MRRRARAAALGALAVVVAGLVVVPRHAAVASTRASADATGGPVGTAPLAPPGDAAGHLRQILRRSPAPEYRRFGSPGMVAASGYAAEVLSRAGYRVVRHDVPSSVWAVDRAPGHEPSLVRLEDGRSFRAEAAFSLTKVTGPSGLSCTLRQIDDVRPGDCGWVPFATVSPRWNNLLADTTRSIDRILAKGGVGAVLQGDLAHDALVALTVRRPLPTVVALARTDEVVGRRVRLRVLGGERPATLHEVVAVRPPTDPSRGSVLLQGHLDGWFAAAADNGGGAAAVLAAAERLARDRSSRGLVIALHDGEEWGLKGSRALAAALAAPGGLAIGPCGGPVLHLADIVSVVNLDAPSAIASDLFGSVRPILGAPVPLVSWRVLVASEEPTVTALLALTSTASGVLGLPVPVAIANAITGGIDRTDGKWFDEAGIPVAWPDAGYPEYHTEADGLSAVDPADLQRVAEGAVALVRALDAAPVGRLPGSALAAPGTVGPHRTACSAARSR